MPAQERAALLELLARGGLAVEGAEVERIGGAELNSRNHRVRLADQAFVVKRAPAARGGARVQAISEHLLGQGVATPRALAWPGGRFALEDGSDTLTRWSAEAGTYLGGSRAELVAAGQLCARLRAALEALPPALAPEPGVSHEVAAMAGTVRRVLARRAEWPELLGAEGAGALEAGIGALARTVDELGRAGLDLGSCGRGAIHLDLHPHNLLRDGDRLTLLDLDSVRAGPVRVELAFACAKLGREAVATGDAGSPAEAVGWILEGWGAGGGSAIEPATLRLAAAAEIARRAVLILDAAEREGDRSWVGVLDIQLSLLAELDSLFAAGPSALPGPIGSERGARLAALAHDGLGARRLFEAELARHPEPLRRELLAAAELASALPYQHAGLSAAAYLSHPLRVATLALRLAEDPGPCALRALVHNVLEVAPAAAAEVTARLGARVRADLEALRVDRSRCQDEAYLEGYYRGIAAAGPAAAAVKVLDKLDNLFVLHLNPSDAVRERYLCELERHVLPLAAGALPQLDGLLRELVADARRLEHLTLQDGLCAFPYPGEPAAQDRDAGAAA